MTTGSFLYLLMTLGMFSTLSVVLAYVSWQQSGPDMIGTRAADDRQAGHDHHPAHA